MKMKVFVGKVHDVEVIFNNWAKGKALTREVLIHTHPLPPLRQGGDDWLAVIVIHPEDPYWDTTIPTPSQIQAATTPAEKWKKTVEVVQ